MVKSYFSIISLVLTLSCAASALNLSNPRDIQNWDSYAIVGDAGIRNSTTEMLRKNLATNKMNQLIVPGDNLYLPTSTYALTWDIWKQEGFQFPLYLHGQFLFRFCLFLQRS